MGSWYKLITLVVQRAKTSRQAAAQSTICQNKVERHLLQSNSNFSSAGKLLIKYRPSNNHDRRMSGYRSQFTRHQKRKLDYQNVKGKHIFRNNNNYMNLKRGEVFIVLNVSTNLRWKRSRRGNRKISRSLFSTITRSA